MSLVRFFFFFALKFKYMSQETFNNSVSDRDKREESHRPPESAERGIAQRMEPQNIQERETQQVSLKIDPADQNNSE